MKTRVVVILEIEGEHDDAFMVVDDILESGVFQDAINGHPYEDCGPLRVVSAVSHAGPEDGLTCPVCGP